MPENFSDNGIIRKKRENDLKDHNVRTKEYRPVYPTIIRIASKGIVSGIRVFGSISSIKNIIKTLLGFKKFNLLDMYVHRRENDVEIILIIEVSSEKTVWDLSGKISEIDGVNFVEIIKPKKGNEEIFINVFEYPLSLANERLTLIPKKIFTKIISSNDDDVLEDIGLQLGHTVRKILNKTVDPETALYILSALGLIDLDNIDTDYDGNYAVKLEYMNSKICILYKTYLESVTGKKIKLNIEDSCCVFSFTDSGVLD